MIYYGTYQVEIKDKKFQLPQKLLEIFQERIATLGSKYPYLGRNGFLVIPQLEGETGICLNCFDSSIVPHKNKYTREAIIELADSSHPELLSWLPMKDGQVDISQQLKTFSPKTKKITIIGCRNRLEIVVNLNS